jgi:O-antigen ligase
MNYSLSEKLFGDPSNSVLDQYGRETASESGFLSMLLDIGILGFSIYLICFITIWRKDKMKTLNNNKKLIGFKYVLLITFISFLQYEHINGNLRGSLFWFMMISFFYTLRDKNKSFRVTV